MQATQSFLDVIKNILINKTFLVIFLLGYSAGLPLLLTMSTLQAWFAAEDISLITIGYIGLVSQPYVFKFLWAPLLDRFSLPVLGYRRGWIFASQIGTAIFLFGMALFDPIYSSKMLAVMAIGVAIMSATQDIAFDAYRTEILLPKDRGIGSVCYVYGYRLAIIVSGSGVLILSFHFGWQFSYILMAINMLCCSLVTIYATEPKRIATKVKNFKEAVIEPFKNFMSREHAIALLLLLITYKLGEAFSVSLQTPFFIKTLHFTTEEVGYIGKVLGTIATLIGLSFGGGLLNYLGLYRALMLFGVLQAVTNLLYIWLVIAGKNYLLLGTVVFIDQFVGGLGTAAFMVLLMSLCNQKYTATQFALLSALAAIGRVYVSPVSGYLVTEIGWINFFIFSVVMSLPSLILLKLLKMKINDYTNLKYSTN